MAGYQMAADPRETGMGPPYMGDNSCIAGTACYKGAFRLVTYRNFSL